MPGVSQNAPAKATGGKQDMTPAQFFAIAAKLQASARRRLDRLPVISRAKTPTTGGL